MRIVKSRVYRKNSKTVLGRCSPKKIVQKAVYGGEKRRYTFFTVLSSKIKDCTAPCFCAIGTLIFKRMAQSFSAVRLSFNNRYL
ncbi:hypothetical protein Dole_1887 [Desulfosudis oleivorans Hxd3]|uniref:Uncharacterized protein n=1 Tax=Desulfosudis oleivorans (strain DSM 6200 / JCM 39069 / Hxd3) TaxID=96561 RepID=A8ZSF4_DESOH|nr:hypothetical protein Dole_1887 [Desulfosudis oleivorans Hxd3]